MLLVLGGMHVKLKASVDYGVRTMAYLAARGEVCSSREISEEMSVPRDYLIQLALRLRKAGLIKARPGKSGGYALAKKASNISIAQVINAFDDDLKHARQEMRKTRNTDERTALAMSVHGAITTSLNSYLDSISIQDLVDAYVDDVDMSVLMADAFEREAARLRK